MADEKDTNKTSALADDIFVSAPSIANRHDKPTQTNALLSQLKGIHSSNSRASLPQSTRFTAPITVLPNPFPRTLLTAIVTVQASLSLDNKDDKGKTQAASKAAPPPPGRRPPPPAGGENVPPRRREPPPGWKRRTEGSSSSPPGRAGAGGAPKRELTEKEKEQRREYYERKRRAEGDKKKAKAHRDHDLIDKLDETNPFGMSLGTYTSLCASQFAQTNIVPVHHAGPYDAVNPSRNKATNRHAPMFAFPKDSVNMSMGGSGPLNKRPDHKTFMGNNDGDATADYGVAAAPLKPDVAMFDPHQRASVIHGDESVGLGTSTFLEGTPAAKAAVEKAQQESSLEGGMEGNGLGRKKSLFRRGLSKREPGFSTGRMTNPEGAYYRDRPSAGSMSSPRGENNPFFNEYEPTKGGEEQLSVRRTSGSTPTDSKTAMPGSLERRVTMDSFEQQQQPPKPKVGLLGRMKSLKGGPRSRAPAPLDRDYV